MLHSLDEIELSYVKDLNTRTLNMSLEKLAYNDTATFPANNYIPKIWENKWYNDDVIGGYSKGDVVWKWTMNEQTFLSGFAEVVQKYALDNPMLCGYFKYDPNEFNKEINRYRNIISGYSQTIGDGNKTHQYFPMLFDYCFDYQNGEYNPSLSTIELYISVVDDNKSLLSDTICWKSIILRTKDDVNNYVSGEISSMFASHIKEYHFDGINSISGYDELLLANNLSNFTIDNVYNALRVNSHDEFVNQQGVDYVTRFKIMPFTTKVVPVSTDNDISISSTMLYRWYRLWNSGYLEHGGIVEIPAYQTSASTQASCYEHIISLDWDREKEPMSIYNYPTLSTPYYGGSFDMLYFAKLSSEKVITPFPSSDSYLGYSKRYCISLTPVTMLSNDISLESSKFKPFSQISALAYPLHANDDINKTYVNFEAHEQTNTSFKITRSNTYDLRDLSTTRYVQYYTTGYVAKSTNDFTTQ